MLLRSVLSAIPTFHLSVFKISVSVEQRLSVEPDPSSPFIGSEVGGVFEYAADVRGVEAKGRCQGWMDLDE